MKARPAVAIATLVLSWAFAGAALAIMWTAGLGTEPIPGVFLSQAPAPVRASFDDIGLAVALLYGPVSALILMRTAHPVGVILAVHAVGSGVAAFGVQWGLLGAQAPGLPLWGFFAFAAGWGFVPGTFMTAALPLLLTRRRLPRWQGAVVVLCVLIALAAWFLSFTQQSVPTPVNPFAIPSSAYQSVLPELYTVLSFAAVGISILSCGVLIARWVAARGRTRTEWAWLTIGHVFLTASYLSLVLPESLSLPGWVMQFGLIAPVVGQVVYPAAILVVVLGQRMWGVEVLISRLVLWALLTVGGVAVYLVMVVIVPLVLPGTEGAWIIAPVAVAMAVQPIRLWLQRRIDRLVYGEGADPSSLVSRLGETIGELEPGPAGLEELAAALARVLRLGAVSIRSARSPLQAHVGESRTPAVTVPLRSADRAVGELEVRAPQGQRLDRRTLAVLDDVAGLVATAVQLIEANLVLERARTELVSLRAQERRAMRRELHDGIGPALAGIGFGLAAVENLAETHPDRAAGLLEELGEDLHRRVRDVRSLAHEVSPSPLDGVSLAEAVGALTRRFDTAEHAVRATVDVPRALADDIQQAAYYIASEALTNAVRHARAARIDVEIRLIDDARVQVRVADDGVGGVDDADPGIGLTSMRERAHRVGGALSVTSGETGTTLVATLPAPES